MYRKTIPALVLSGCLAMTACLAIPAFPAQASQEIYHISEDDSPVEYYSPEEIRDFFHSRPLPGPSRIHSMRNRIWKAKRLGSSAENPVGKCPEYPEFHPLYRGDLR